MTGAEFKTACIKLFGRKKWRPHAAAALAVNESTIWRVEHRPSIQGPYIVALAGLQAAKKQRDELNKAADQLLRDRKRLARAKRK